MSRIKMISEIEENYAGALEYLLDTLAEHLQKALDSGDDARAEDCRTKIREHVEKLRELDGMHDEKYKVIIGLYEGIIGGIK
jgi:hypothetical protein